MKARGVDARPGWSWTQVGRSVHVFEVDGGSPPYPETPEIYGEMSRLVSQIRMVGYVPDNGCVAYVLPEEEKERLLLCHTENLGSSNSLVGYDMDPYVVVTHSYGLQGATGYWVQPVGDGSTGYIQLVWMAVA
nr:pentatricopeptide repeat-containing protein At4g01030, mitochondrial-like [Aegilops tauschii subsp. strangulata]